MMFYLKSGRVIPVHLATSVDFLVILGKPRLRAAALSLCLCDVTWHPLLLCLFSQEQQSQWVKSSVCCCCCDQLCLTLCYPIDCHLRGPSVHGIFQARVLERVAIPTLRYLPIPTKGSSPCLLHLLHWQADSLPLMPPGKPLVYYSMTSS